MGSAAVINPLSGMPMPQEQTVIELSDLHPEYRARAVAASQALGKAVRQQNIMAVLGVFSQNPILLQALNWSRMAREVLDTFDFKDPDALLNQQFTQLNMQASQMQGGGGTAPGPFGQPGGQAGPQPIPGL